MTIYRRATLGVPSLENREEVAWRLRIIKTGGFKTKQSQLLLEQVAAPKRGRRGEEPAKAEKLLPMPVATFLLFERLAVVLGARHREIANWNDQMVINSDLIARYELRVAGKRAKERVLKLARDRLARQLRAMHRKYALHLRAKLAYLELATAALGPSEYFSLTTVEPAYLSSRWFRDWIRHCRLIHKFGGTEGSDSLSPLFASAKRGLLGEGRDNKPVEVSYWTLMEKYYALAHEIQGYRKSKRSSAETKTLLRQINRILDLTLDLSPMMKRVGSTDRRDSPQDLALSIIEAVGDLGNDPSRDHFKNSISALRTTVGSLDLTEGEFEIMRNHIDYSEENQKLIESFDFGPVLNSLPISQVVSAWERRCQGLDSRIDLDPSDD